MMMMMMITKQYGFVSKGRLTLQALEHLTEGRETHGLLVTSSPEQANELRVQVEVDLGLIDCLHHFEELRCFCFENRTEGFNISIENIDEQTPRKKKRRRARRARTRTRTRKRREKREETETETEKKER